MKATLAQKQTRLTFVLHVMGRPEACRKPGAEIRAAPGLMWREMQCLAAFAVGGAAPKPANVPGFRAKGSESERKPARKDRISHASSVVRKVSN